MHNTTRVEKGRSNMHARVITARLQPGTAEESIQIIRNSVLPEARKQQGFKGFLLLTDPTKDTATVVSLWETAAALQAGETSGYFQQQLAKVAQVFASPPTREVYQVSILEVEANA